MASKITINVPDYDYVAMERSDITLYAKIEWQRTGGNTNTVQIPNDVFTALVNALVSPNEGADDRTATPWQKHVQARLDALEDTLKEKLCDWDG